MQEGIQRPDRRKSGYKPNNLVDTGVNFALNEIGAKIAFFADSDGIQYRVALAGVSARNGVESRTFITTDL